MWAERAIKIIVFVFFLTVPRVDVCAKTMSRDLLCSLCSCSVFSIMCRNLANPDPLLNYNGPDVTFLYIVGSKLYSLQYYLKKFENTSSVTIVSSDIGSNFSAYSLKKVINLNLFNNSLKSLDDELFKYNTNLITLNLEYNDISFVAENTFKNQHHLLRLRLSHNSISHLLPNIFVDLSNLKELDLSANKIQDLEEATLVPLVTIKSLNISDNVIKNLDKRTLDRLSTLETLDVSSNEIQSVDVGTFASLECLRVLCLRDNLLEEVEEGTWSGLSSLEELDLGGNRLLRAPAHAFSPLARLRALSLRDNLLEEVEEGAWSGLEAALEELDLSGNRLLRADAAAFAPLRALRVLRLERNRIASFGPALVEALAQRPGLSAQLQPNPLRCACGNGELRDAWAAASARGLRWSLVCADGRPWDAAMRDPSCSDGSGETQGNATTDSTLVTEASSNSQTNLPYIEEIPNATFPEGNAVTLTPEHRFLETTECENISTSSGDNIVTSPWSVELNHNFIYDNFAVQDISRNIEFTLVLLVCVVAFVFSVAFAVTLVTCLIKGKYFQKQEKRNVILSQQFL